MKKLLLLLTLIILITSYIIIYQTNLIAEPTFTLSEKTSVILNGDIVEEVSEPIQSEDLLYIDMAFLAEHMGLDLAWDNKNQTVVYYNEEDIFRLYDNRQLKINREIIGETDFLLIKDGRPYIELNFIENYTDYDINYIEDTNILIIDKPGSIIKTANIKERVRVREEESIWSNVKYIVEEGEPIFIYNATSDWVYIRTQLGVNGYIPLDSIVNEVEIDYEDTAKEITEPNTGERINLTWEYVYSKTPSVDKLEKVDGLDVISPTWFSLENENGDIISKASAEYVLWAKSNNYKVWGLFDNNFDPDLTSVILNDSRLRELVINRITELALFYKLDGINLDFENVYYKDKDMLTQFVKELRPITKENNLVLSIDVTIKSSSENWSMFYDRVELGKLVDYMMLMAYDEYWAGAGASGSVASIPWVERGIQTLLEDVPNYKVILGVPFYTRVWKEQTTEDGLKITSSAVSMATAEDLLNKNNGTIVWDSVAKQYYGQYTKDGIVHKVWIEDERSMEERLKLISKYDLAGIASWRRGFEKKEIWDVIKQQLNQ